MPAASSIAIGAVVLGGALYSAHKQSEGQDRLADASERNAKLANETALRIRASEEKLERQIMAEEAKVLREQMARDEYIFNRQEETAERTFVQDQIRSGVGQAASRCLDKFAAGFTNIVKTNNIEAERAEIQRLKDLGVEGADGYVSRSAPQALGSEETFQADYRLLGDRLSEVENDLRGSETALEEDEVVNITTGKVG